MAYVKYDSRCLDKNVSRDLMPAGFPVLIFLATEAKVVAKLQKN
jgi:hypothetical protein